MGRLVAEEGSKSIGDGGRRRLRGIHQQRVSHKSTCFFSICLLFVPSRPLVSSCSGPVGFSLATMIYLQNPCLSNLHRSIFSFPSSESSGKNCSPGGGVVDEPVTAAAGPEELTAAGVTG